MHAIKIARAIIAALLVFVVTVASTGIVAPHQILPAASADPNGPGVPWPPGPGPGTGPQGGQQAGGQQGGGKVAPQAPVNPGQVAPDPAVAPNTGNTGNSGNTGPNVQSPNIPNAQPDGKPIFNGGQQNPGQNPAQQSPPAQNSPPQNTAPDTQGDQSDASSQKPSDDPTDSEVDPDSESTPDQHASKPKECEPDPDGFTFPQGPVKKDVSADEWAKWRNFTAKARSDKRYTDLQGQTGKQVDHIIPLSRLWNLPGFKSLSIDQMVAIANRPENLKVIPWAWNRNKSAATPKEWVPKDTVRPFVTEADWIAFCNAEGPAKEAVLDQLAKEQEKNAQATPQEGSADSDGSGSGSDSGSASQQQGGQQDTQTPTTPPTLTQDPTTTVTVPTTTVTVPQETTPGLPATQEPTTANPPEVNPRVPTTSNTEPPTTAAPTEAPATTAAPQPQPSFLERHREAIGTTAAIAGVVLLCVALCAETGGAALAPILALF